MNMAHTHGYYQKSVGIEPTTIGMLAQFVYLLSCGYALRLVRGYFKTASSSFYTNVILNINIIGSLWLNVNRRTRPIKGALCV